MTDEGQDPPIDGEGSSRFHIVQPLRDLESNWAVDLAKSLEDYLLKICSGEISGGEAANFSINFAEAALLLQGSIQVYSRKVEYLYSLVLQTLEFISQKRAQDQEEGPASQPKASTSRAVRNEHDDQFWCSDDVPVDAKNFLDSQSTKDAFQNRLVKPPANLVVLEGDGLDSTGDGELETYLLAMHDLYRDFILLDPCDSSVVDDFLKGDISGEGQYGTHKGSSLRSKGHKTFMSPIRQSGGTARKSTAKKNENNIGEPSAAPCDMDPGPAACEIPQNDNFDFPMDDHHSEPEFFDDADSDDEDPWKPLNPHEHGNLKVKPFRKVKIPRRQAIRKKASATAEFPLAKLDGPINPQLHVYWEMHVRTRNKQNASSEPLLYFEKLRQSLLDGAHEIHCGFHNPEDANNDKDMDDGFGEPGFDMPGGAFGMDEDEDFHQEKHDDFGDTHNDNLPDNPEEISSQATLEDLCRAHLDALLASIAETEQQTELVARVTSWKQRIEHNLEEQDSRPPFDIHEYGERVLEKFSLEKDEDSMPFTDVVSGQEKHDIARTFSAMLQLVNDGNIDLEKPAPSGESFCYTVVNPFYVRCLGKQDNAGKRIFPQPKKRPNSAIKNKSKQTDANLMKRQPSNVSPRSISRSLTRSTQQNDKFRAKKLGVPVIGRCTPDSKRRRKSRLVEQLEPADLRSAS